ncbi:transposase [Orrella marina]|uniref:transposase n=1 Tax=Orrella marina TaxID=2163011 RepID=UPI001D13097F
MLINNIKTASARGARNRFTEHLAAFYKKPQFWHRACFVGSVGSATLAPPAVRSASPKGSHANQSD